jgi:hypothetical protein
LFWVGSVPVTLLVTVRVSLMAANRAQRLVDKNKTEDKSKT